MIIRRYVMLEIGRYLAAIAVGLLFLVLSVRVTAYLADAADGRIAPDHILSLLALKLVLSLKDVLPLSLFLAVFAGLMRLERDREIAIMRATGLRARVLVGAVLGVALPVSLAVGGLTMFGTSMLKGKLELVEDEAQDEATIAGVRAGRFQEIARYDRVIYAEGVTEDDSALRDAFVQAREGARTGVMRAHKAFVEANADRTGRYAVFVDGTSYAGLPGELDYEITQFHRYGLLIEPNSGPKARSDAELSPAGVLLASPELAARAELQYRLATPIATLVLALLAYAMASGSGGRRADYGMVAAIAIFFLYTNLLGIAKALMLKGATPPGLGLLWVHVAFLLLLVALQTPLRGATRLAAPARAGR
jgi:lipopolysaccharide export system permease protein